MAITSASSNKGKGKTVSSAQASLKKPVSTASQDDNEGFPDDEDDLGFNRQSMDHRSDDEDEDMIIDPSTVLVPTSNTPMDVDASELANSKLSFPALKDHSAKETTQSRKVGIPPHRMTPLKRDWINIYTPLVEECGLQVRMNPKKRTVEIRTSKHTPAPQSTILQKSVDFLNAYVLGFSAEDAIALVRMDDLYIESFEVKDVKMLHGDHLSRAIGRIAGKDGKTRFTIENASRTRIVLADSKIHILGTFGSIKIARDAICALILGSPPGKVYNNLRNVVARQRQRF